MSPRTATVTGDLFDVTRHAWRAPAPTLQQPATVAQHAPDCRLGNEYELAAAWCPCTLGHPDLDA